MSKVSVARKFTFEASHHLPNYNGKCARDHGHSYTMVVTVSGDLDPQTGMIMDFGLLKSIVNEHILSNVDHNNLNEIFYNPTAENMAVSFYDTLSEAIKLDCPLSHVHLDSIELWETANCYAIYKGEQ